MAGLYAWEASPFLKRKEEEWMVSKVEGVWGEGGKGNCDQAVK